MFHLHDLDDVPLCFFADSESQGKAFWVEVGERASTEEEGPTEENNAPQVRLFLRWHIFHKTIPETVVEQKPSSKPTINVISI
jgi:hypothetical protein